MTELGPLRFRQDPDLPRELALGLLDGVEELPTPAEIGHLRANLAAVVGEPLRFRRSATAASLRDALTTSPGEEPSAAELRALRSGLPTSQPAPLRRRANRAKSLAWLTWALPAAAAALVLGGGYWAGRRALDGSASPPVAVNWAPLPSSFGALAPLALPTSPTNLLSSASPAEPSRPVAPSSSPDELSLLREAQQALGSDPALALRLANRHAAAHPRGILSQEREVVAIDALVRLGQRTEARSRARRFELSHPGSAYIPRIERLIGGPAPAPTR